MASMTIHEYMEERVGDGIFYQVGAATGYIFFGTAQEWLDSEDGLTAEYIARLEKSIEKNKAAADAAENNAMAKIDLACRTAKMKDRIAAMTEEEVTEAERNKKEPRTKEELLNWCDQKYLDCKAAVANSMRKACYHTNLHGKGVSARHKFKPLSERTIKNEYDLIRGGHAVIITGREESDIWDVDEWRAKNEHCNSGTEKLREVLDETEVAV